MAVVAVGFRFLRGNDDYYDDEDDDDYDFGYDVDSVVGTAAATSTQSVARPPSSPPTKPEPISQPEPEVEPEVEQDSGDSEDWMIDYRIEDDGTEWGQADDEVWYYRESGQSEWVEWSD